MMGAVSMEAKETTLLGDFDIDLLRQTAPRTNLINMYHLRQVIIRPTRVTASSESLIDHICASDVNNVIEHCVPASALVITTQSASHGHVRGPNYLQQGTK